MVVAQKEEVLLLIDNFLGHKVPNIGQQWKVTWLKFVPLNTRSRFQSIDAWIIQSFKAQYHKPLIQHYKDLLIENKNKDVYIYIYIYISICHNAWCIGVITSTIIIVQKIYIFLSFILIVQK